MKHLTSLEMFLNMVTTTLWVNFITSVGDVVKADKFNSTGEIITASLYGVGIVVVIAGIIIFYSNVN